MHKCREYGITLRANHVGPKDSAANGEYKAEDPAPYGFNPYTGEIFDERGYPADWDDIQLDEHQEYETEFTAA